MNSAVVTIVGVGTGVVVIVVAAAVVLLVLTVAASMRGGQKRAAQRHDATQRELIDARERAEHAEHDRDVAEGRAERETDPGR